MPRFFEPRELETMDDLTANNKVVLASLGGAPKRKGESVPKDSGVLNVDTEVLDEKSDV